MLAVKSHSEQNGDDTRRSGAKRVWRHMSVRGREIAAAGKRAARKLGAAIRDYYRAKHGVSASAFVGAEFAVTDRQVRRWFSRGPQIDSFALMLETEKDRLLDHLAAAFGSLKNRRRFRWRRGTKEA